MGAECGVVTVWDGLRPDYVSAEATPNLWQLAQQGVWFERGHAVQDNALVNVGLCSWMHLLLTSRRLESTVIDSCIRPLAHRPGGQPALS